MIFLALLFEISTANAETPLIHYDNGITAEAIAGTTSGDIKLSYLQRAAQNFESAVKSSEISDQPSLSIQERIFAIQHWIQALKSIGPAKNETLISQLTADLRELLKLKINEGNSFSASFQFWVPRFRSKPITALPAKVVYSLIANFKKKPPVNEAELQHLADKVQINLQELNPAEKQMLVKILSNWNHAKPKSEKDGQFFRTEKLGNMYAQSTQIHEEFFSFGAPKELDDRKPVLDIGCAYGYNTHKALKKGAYVLATDLDPKLLSVLVQTTPPDLLDRLDIHLGEFTKDSLNLEPNSVKAVLLSNVIHYLSPAQLIAGLREIYQALASGGRLYLNAITPSYGGFNDPERRDIDFYVKKALQNPGEIGILGSDLAQNFPTYIQYFFQEGEEFFHKRPDEFIRHPQLSEVTSIIVARVGFRVEKAGNFISMGQMFTARAFAESEFRILPVFSSSGKPNERSMARKDFSEYRNQLAKATNANAYPEMKDLPKILGDESKTWPIHHSSVGGDMYLVATKP